MNKRMKIATLAVAAVMVSSVALFAAGCGKSGMDATVGKFTYKEEREYETIDADIAALEAKLEELDGEIMANATNSVKLRELMGRKEEVQAQLDGKMERWVYLSELAEKIGR